jgi:hypothetical protein
MATIEKKLPAAGSLSVSVAEHGADITGRLAQRLPEQVIPETGVRTVGSASHHCRVSIA